MLRPYDLIIIKHILMVGKSYGRDITLNFFRRRSLIKIEMSRQIKFGCD